MARSFWPFGRRRAASSAQEVTVGTSASYSIRASIEGLRLEGRPAGRAALLIPATATVVQFQVDAAKKPAPKPSAVHVLQMLTPQETGAILDDVQRIGSSIGWCARLARRTAPGAPRPARRALRGEGAAAPGPAPQQLRRPTADPSAPPSCTQERPRREPAHPGRAGAEPLEGIARFGACSPARARAHARALALRHAGAADRPTLLTLGPPPPARRRRCTGPSASSCYPSHAATTPS